MAKKRGRSRLGAGLGKTSGRALLRFVKGEESMKPRLEGKTAVITGAGQGIGRAVAVRFAGEGGRVWATSRSRGPLQSLRSISGIEIRTLDVTCADDIARMSEEIASADVLVNCAGYVANGTLLDCTEEDLQHSFDVNVRGAFLMTRAFLPAMLEKGHGSVINIASVLSSIAGAPNRLAYMTAKAALIGFTRSVAVDYVHRGIRCNALCPGAVSTPGLESRIAGTDDPEATRQAFLQRHPVGRLGKAEEVADACVYLASDESRFMTGQCLVLDGGMTL
jgi:2-keto-3-deoxy-L-fuconate dehydrogenase